MAKVHLTAPTITEDQASPQVGGGLVYTGFVSPTVQHHLGDWIYQGYSFTSAADLASLSDFINSLASEFNVDLNSWSFDPSNAELQFLGEDEAINLVFDVDVHGTGNTSASGDMTIRITGNNDAPTITVGTGDTASASLAESNSTLTASGTLTVHDPDLSDVLYVIALSSGNPTGFTEGLPIGVIQSWMSVTPVTLSANPGESSNLSWSFDSDGFAFDYLGEGETVTLHYGVAVEDSHDATGQHDIDITITGVNDSPTFSTSDSGSVTEDVAVVSGELSASGTIDFSDPDWHDTHTADATISASATWYTEFGGTTSANSVGSLDVSITNDPSSGPDGQVHWSFHVDNADIQFLGLSESLVETFHVHLSDPYGGSATTDVVITIEGANDLPSITDGDFSATVTEDDAATLSASGSLTFTDVDINDTHGASVTGTTGNYVGNFTLTGTNDFSASGTIGWSFAASNSSSAIQALGVGESITQIYHVHVEDNHNATDIQDVTITINGVNDSPSFSSSDTGSLTEDNVTFVAASGSFITTSGSVGFTDVDIHDSHSVTWSSDATLSGSSWSVIGNFDATISYDSTTSSDGGVAWTFSVDNADVQFLGATETLTETFHLHLSDHHGGVATTDVTIQIEGVNDSPSFTGSGTFSGDVTEDAASTLETSGTISFTDVDIHDSHSVSSITGTTGNYVGTFSANVTSESNGAGYVEWNFSVDDSNDVVQSLGENETLTQTYTVYITDHHGGEDSQDITVVIHGVNDAPTFTNGSSATLTEDSSTPSLTATGSIGFNDADANDLHSVSFSAEATWAGSSTQPIGTFDVSVSTDSTVSSTGYVQWTFTVDNDDVQFLGSGEALVETFHVHIGDGHGGGDTTDVVVSITGENDAPSITSGTFSASITEDVTSGTLYASGQISFTDVDLHDSHSVTYTTTDASFDYVGSFSVDIGGSGSGSGTIDWSFSVSDSNTQIQSLGASEFVTQVYHVQLSDGHTTATTDVTVNIYGVNDVHTGNVYIYDTATNSGAGPGPFAGDVLTASNDIVDVDNFTFSGDYDDPSFDYQWLRDGTPIANATGASYTLTNGDSGHQISLQISYVDDGGVLETETSDAVTIAVHEIGTPGRDTLTGGATDDWLEGLGGNDTLRGLGGDDTLDGGSGNDSLAGGDGNDSLDGGPGRDTMQGGAGDDTYVVDATNDVVVEAADAGNDTVYASATYTIALYVENLVLTGASAINGTGNGLNNMIDGNTAANSLSGAAGNDTIFGGDGNDTILGGNGDDSLDGGNNNDSITGGVGADSLTGGAGADKFVFTGTADSTVKASGRDTILDFSGGAGDLVDVSGIDANTTTKGNQAFTFIGTAAFTHAGQLRFDDATHTLYGNVDANLNPDFAVVILGVSSAQLTGHITL
ncbi:MAG TPA: VCBS domain-containing protein [Ramlibacter sp.]|uniref:beta strand repeat-containing protein n=1 Tax=Ramlibacter sp. TaxID=1917967 RepID=UPI002BCE19E1|nr:VCBS domain-containing protein [Ramlibacter sp.]HVZ43896.1 VCBS domain-containing protein [Ramlibacter sp.]